MKRRQFIAATGGGVAAAGLAKPKKLLDSTIAFHNEEYLWFQVAEYSYDNFLIRQRAKT